MEKQISKQEVVIYLSLIENNGQWLTAQQVHEMTSVPIRTVRAKLTQLLNDELIIVQKLHDSFMYFLKLEPLKSSHSYLWKIKAAADAYKIPIPEFFPVLRTVETINEGRTPQKDKFFRSLGNELNKGEDFYKKLNKLFYDF